MRVLIFGKGGISQGIANVLDHEVIQLTREEADVLSRLEVEAAFHDHLPDWVINCAGLSCPPDPVGEIEVNLIGAFHVAEVVMDTPQIHIASVAGLYGKPGHAGYSASKAGVISMVQSLAMEGRDIWAISPGRVDTPMRERDYPNDTPGSRLEPEAIGRVVRTIMDGYYVSGTNVIIRKVGLHTTVIQPDRATYWRETLRVGQPVTI